YIARSQPEAIAPFATCRNPQLPTFVANCARASAHLYAFSKFADLKDWRRAATSLKHIYHHSLMLASDILFKLSLSKA
ncbi:glycosyltransferase family 2 protein, partial [Rhizobium johnstonii]